MTSFVPDPFGQKITREKPAVQQCATRTQFAVCCRFRNNGNYIASARSTAHPLDGSVTLANM
jgi:hypothetical protein